MTLMKKKTSFGIEDEGVPKRLMSNDKFVLFLFKDV